jgi:hypothetical protein
MKAEQVRLIITIGGIRTAETKCVLRVDEDGVWLDNGYGNDPDGPYDSETGEYLGDLFMGSRRIAKLFGA